MEINEKNERDKRDPLVKASIRLMLRNDVDWPTLLDHIYDPPRHLFIRGSWPPRFVDGTAVNKETKFLCIVGARKHSDYGREACKSLIAGLAGYNICIVSGLALGIDAIAHESALAARIPTVAFPGSGLNQNVLYPPRNVRLAERILAAGGTLLSEFDVDMQATPWCFQARNRLMAGICHATLVIEAKCPSGTLITSKYSKQYNRDVFAIPGDIFSPLSAGPHMLIKDGAAVIRNSEDILHELGIKIHDDDPVKQSKKQNQNDEEVQNSLFDTIHGKTENEKTLYKIILDAGGKISVDKLIQNYTELSSNNSIDIPHTISLLTIMEMSGLIQEKNGIIHLVHYRI